MSRGTTSLHSNKPQRDSHTDKCSLPHLLFFLLLFLSIGLIGYSLLLRLADLSLLFDASSSLDVVGDKPSVDMTPQQLYHPAVAVIEQQTKKRELLTFSLSNLPLPWWSRNSVVLSFGKYRIIPACVVVSATRFGEIVSKKAYGLARYGVYFVVAGLMTAKQHQTPIPELRMITRDRMSLDMLYTMATFTLVDQSIKPLLRIIKPKKAKGKKKADGSGGDVGEDTDIPRHLNTQPPENPEYSWKLKKLEHIRLKKTESEDSEVKLSLTVLMAHKLVDQNHLILQHDMILRRLHRWLEARPMTELNGSLVNLDEYTTFMDKQVADSYPRCAFSFYVSKGVDTESGKVHSIALVHPMMDQCIGNVGFRLVDPMEKRLPLSVGMAGAGAAELLVAEGAKLGWSYQVNTIKKTETLKP
eukprot:GHVQ01019288.1.p1 GENE.GHVQ01019288.1~~GHVQ01019288.1.p1  ORF type:complete len:414 (+),score=51.98 GHVQ01019288.1:203-1444(+)